MQMTSNLCTIPCNSLPLVSEADFGLCLRPIAHCDRTADFNVLIYLLKGSMEIIEDGMTYTLVPGTLFFLKSNVHHWGEKPFEVGTAWYYIHFYTADCSPSMPCFENKSTYFEKKSLLPNDFALTMVLPKILTLPLGNALEKQIEKLIYLHHSFYATDLMKMNLVLWEILLHCFELEQGKMMPPGEDQLTQKVTNFLEQHLTHHFSPDELSKALNLSYKYIGTLFKAKTGMTIKQYELMLRLRKAVKLLCETNLSITEIAHETGFNDAFYFSKVFKKEKGLSPLQFRASYVPKI